MLQKTKWYYDAHFLPTTIENFYNSFVSKLNPDVAYGDSSQRITIENETWKYDTFEEFLAEYQKATSFSFDYYQDKNRNMNVNGGSTCVRVSVALPTRGDIQSVFQVLERDLDKAAIPQKQTLPIKSEAAPIKIFIGHGHDKQWRDLKDHLHELHGFEVVAYEIGPRAGLSVKEVLQKMLNESSIAFLVLTGEDETTDGEIHARQNVIHEVGLFQGRLGFERAIILLEKDVQEFSNIFGINQIRFSKGNIKEAYGDVLAILRREFDQGNE